MIFRGIKVLFLCLQLIQGVLCLVELELSVLQFDNPLGTSYTGQNAGTERKCCDVGGSDCKNARDKCDVYFTFCIGTQSHDPLHAGCNGTSIDMQKDVSADVLKISDNRNLTRYVTVDTWVKGSTRLIVNVLDIDELPSTDNVPHIFPDLIDAFDRLVNFDPAPNYWTAKNTIVSLIGHVSIGLRLRAWCARGWYGKSCENRCIADYFHSCLSDGTSTPHRECTDPDTSVLSVRKSISTLNNVTDLRRTLINILANDVCLKTTDNITVNIHEIREYRYDLTFDFENQVRNRFNCDIFVLHDPRFKNILQNDDHLGYIPEGIVVHEMLNRGNEERKRNELLLVITKWLHADFPDLITMLSIPPNLTIVEVTQHFAYLMQITNPGVLCLVELELSVLQFDNPLGTSYTGQNAGTERKCCDVGGSDCKNARDKCDVYFTFCIGTQSHDPLHAGCNGTSIDMQKDVSADVLKISDNRNLTRYVTVDTWVKGSTRLIVNVLDIDELPSTDNVPHIFPDLIDAFDRLVNFDPAPNYWTAKNTIVSLIGHVSIGLRLRAWCARGWYGKSCENRCIADYFHSCLSDGTSTPHRECTDPDTSVLSVRKSISTLNNVTDLRRTLINILANDVCLKTTDNITVNIHEIREYRYDLTFDFENQVRNRFNCDIFVLHDPRFKNILQNDDHLGYIPEGIVVHEMLNRGNEERKRNELLLVITKWLHADGVLCLVELELSVLQFDNPLGTSYTGQNAGTERKCCDVGGSDCKNARDKCDVYFTFCIGTQSHDPLHAGCNGTSIDMQKDVSADVLKISDNRNLTRYVTVDTWVKGSTRLIVNVLDIDELPSTDNVPHIFPDLIDAFDRLVNFDPAPNYWTAKNTIVSLIGHVSIGLRLRAWCARGWYGKSCENRCIADYFHSCLSDGTSTPHRECTDPDTSVLSVRKSISTLNNVTDLRRTLINILANDVCLKTTDNITVNIHEIREYSHRQLNQIDIVFNGYCDNRPVSSLKFREMVYVMNNVKTRLVPLDDLLGFPVKTPEFKFVSEENGHVIVVVRLVSYKNLISNCSLRNTGSPCNPTFKIYFSSSRKVSSDHAIGTNSLTDCNGDLVDLMKFQTPANTIYSTTLFVLQHFPKNTTVFIEIKDTVVQAFTALHQFSVQNVSIGTNFYDAFPERFQKSINQNTELTIEVMAFCGNCKTGDRCQTTVSGGCDSRKTTLQRDCKSNNDCQHGGRCAEKETCLCMEGWTGPICNTDIDECALDMCVHADSCINTRGGYTCVCSKGFTGQNCEIDIDECMSQPCRAGLACLNLYGSYHCIGVCTNNKLNVTCSGTVDFCSNEPCQNNGTCTTLSSNFSCDCNAGWTGSACEVNVNECTNTTLCDNGGLCMDTLGSFHCACPSNFTGAFCDIDVDECLDPTSCKNNGTCSNNEGGFSCNCTKGFTGKTCNEDIDDCGGFNDCQNGICMNTVGGYICSCLSGWEGVACNVDIDECLDPTSCINNATCVNIDGGYACQCPGGFTGSRCESDIDECASNRCLHGTCLNSFGGYKCFCFPGWYGVNCDIDRDECLAKTPCDNNGTCVNTFGSYSCKCTEHWTDDHCQTDVDECSILSTCNSHGNCTNLIGSFSCTCLQGWAGSSCNVDIDECLNSVCKNNGSCINTDGGFVCNCSRNWSGNNCDIDVDECKLFAPCQHGGSCNNTLGSYTCSCPENWTGVNCADDFDECLLTNPCLNGGLCNNTDGSYRCTCPPQWTGSKCETDINECLESPCANNGSCSNKMNGYTCSCLPAWTGQNCTVNIDECSVFSRICKYGVCKDSVGSYSCDCSPGYQGQNCSEDVNECKVADMCNNNGTCVNSIGSYACHCTNGWTGLNCSNDLNECQKQNICQNEGTCVNINGGFNCQCRAGWTGSVCEQDINECETYPCLNGGSCTNANGSFSCSCKVGWNGETCNKNINDCKPDTCKNGGKCKDLVNEFICSCFNGYTGKVCDIDINECKPNPCNNGGTCHDHIGYFECVCRDGWNGTSCNSDINECKNQPCGRGETCVNSQGSYKCLADFGITASPFTTKKGLTLENAIKPGCTLNGWNVSVDMSILKQMYPEITSSHIYFGDNTCHGKEIGHLLLFQQGFRNCLTSERVSTDTLIYENIIFYAIYDPINPFIIRQHKWTFKVECDVTRNQATSSHIHHDVNSHQAAASGQYDVKMEFYTDTNFMNKIPGDFIHVQIGDTVYVKVFTTAADWTIKMRLHTCYTKPDDNARDEMTYFIIKNGCEVDSNTHIISQSTHETRFVFQDFEYSTNREGLNIYCNATFCETQDYSPGCAQSCVSPGTQALVGK